MLKKVYEYIKDNEFRFTVFTNRIHIINYFKIELLSDNYIVVTANDRTIKIDGVNLVLNRLVDNEALVVGDVKKIEVSYDE